MSRNFGLGSRNMVSAAKIALHHRANQNTLADGTVAKYGGHFKRFADVFLYPHGVRRLEQVRRKHVLDYGEAVANDVYVEDYGVQTGHARITSINVVMDIATHGNWESVGAVSDCDLPERDYIRTLVPHALDWDEADRIIQLAIDSDSDAGHIAALARTLGLRAREAILFDSSEGLKEALQYGYVIVVRGTKGGRPRRVTVTQTRQIQALECAAMAQGRRNCLIPQALNYVQFLDGAVRKVRDVIKSLGLTGFHELRASYACDYYQRHAGFPAPCVQGGKPADKQVDAMVRKMLSPELGHNRIDIVGAYVGGR